MCVVRQRLSDALDIIQHTNFATGKLHQPNCHRVRAVPGATDVEECPDRQYWIDRNVTDPALLPRALDLSDAILSALAHRRTRGADPPKPSRARKLRRIPEDWVRRRKDFDNAGFDLDHTGGFQVNVMLPRT